LDFGGFVNFVQAEFWWKLLGFGVPLLGMRAIAGQMGVGKSWIDRSSLLMLSLLLFWNLSPLSFAILCLEGVISYQIIRFFQTTLPTTVDQPRNLKARLVLATGTIALLAVLAGFKYGQPASWIAALPIVGTILTVPKVGMVAPGLSFHTFQMISAMVDAYRNRLTQPMTQPMTQPIKKLDYANFVFLFPQAVSGPIERWEQLGTKLSNFQFSAQQLEPGLCWMSLGLFMKLVLADNLMRHGKLPIADVNSAWCIWLYVWIYGMRLYFDFAGYSFIALGLGKAIGIDLEINFLAPYTATNIQDFWRRWNVTLSTWFRDYLFIPLGGSRVPWGMLNLLAVFLASGIWHGSGINFILWGLYHGILIIINRLWERHLPAHPWARQLEIPPWLGWFLTVSAALLGWVFFVESDLGRLQKIGMSIVSLSSYSFENLIYEWTILRVINPLSFFILITLCLMVLGYELYCVHRLKKMPYSILVQPKFALLLLGLTIVLANREPGQFIYFSF
jgi:alginate O-acetyltransferase complex protein AlgI